jgi:uncharacterized membrane protein
MSFSEAMEHVAQAFEALGALVLLAGLLLAVGLAARSWWRGRDGRLAYRVLRESFGAVILLGLEILVAADLVRTVAVAPTAENVLILGVIVLIRTFLSFSLEVEIEGVPPWRRGLTSGAGRLRSAARRPSASDDRKR